MGCRFWDLVLEKGGKMGVAWNCVAVGAIVVIAGMATTGEWEICGADDGFWGECW